VQSGLIELQTKADNAKSTAEIQSIRTLINSFTQVRAGVLHIRHAHACAQQRFLAAHGDGCVTYDHITSLNFVCCVMFYAMRRAQCRVRCAV
jgi:hypothetical protein